MGSSSFLVCGGRGSIVAVSDEVLQWECIAAAKFMGAPEESMGDHREIHGR